MRTIIVSSTNDGFYEGKSIVEKEVEYDMFGCRKETLKLWDGSTVIVEHKNGLRSLTEGLKKLFSKKIEFR